MTNYEKLREDTNNFAEFLKRAFPGCQGCPIKDFCTKHADINSCKETFKAWLESEIEEDDEIH